MRVKAVTFDLWETLLFENEGSNELRINARARNLSRAFHDYGLEVSVQESRRVLGAIQPLLIARWNENCDIPHRQLIRAIIGFVKADPNARLRGLIQGLSSAIVSPLYELPPRVNGDAIEVLRRLKMRKKRIGLICNTGMTPGFALRDFLEKNNVLKYFDAAIFSEEVSFRKPSEKIFLLACRRLMSKPEETVHIGDNPKIDVAGAKNAGMRAIHFLNVDGRDKLAESDPQSLVSLSKDAGKLYDDEKPPDKTVTSLLDVLSSIEEIESGRSLTI